MASCSLATDLKCLHLCMYHTCMQTLQVSIANEHSAGILYTSTVFTIVIT